MLFTGCKEYTPTHQHLSVIIDLTDKDNYRPTPKQVLNYIAKGHESDGLELSLRYVAETRYAPKHHFSLPQGEVGWLANEDMRRRKRKHLLGQFSDTLSTLNKVQKPLPRSEIFRLVIEEVTHLSKQKGKRTLLLYSDLKEFSPLISVYDTRQQARLLKSPQEMAAKLASGIELPHDLSGITIHILYVPSLEDDPLFTAMVAVYREVLEPLGAEIRVGIHDKITL